MSDLGVAIAAAALTIAGTFLIEQWRRRAEHRADAKNLRAALAAEMRLIRRAIHDEAKRARLRPADFASADFAEASAPRAPRRIPTPVFEATAGSLGLLGSASLISRVVRLCGAMDALPESLAQARSAGTGDTAHVRAGDLLLSIWRRARELEVELADRDVEEIPAYESALFHQIESEALHALEAAERAGVSTTVMIPKVPTRR
jgi:hypothetical protein